MAKSERVNDLTTNDHIEISDSKMFEKDIFSALFYQSPVMSLVIQSGTNEIIHVNNLFLEFSRLKKEVVVNKKLIEIPFFNSVNQLLELLNAATDGIIKNEPFEFQTREKLAGWVSVSAKKIILGNKECFFLTLCDITETITLKQEKSESYELFPSLFEQNPIAISISNITDEKIINVNESFIQLYGFMNKEQIIGKTYKELKIWMDPNAISEIVHQLKKSNKVVNTELEIRTPQGELKWVSTSALLVESNGKTYFVAVTLNITKRIVAEKELKEVNYFLNAVLDNIPNMIFVKGAKELRFLKFNKAGEKLLGFKFEDLFNKNDYDFFPKEQADFFTSKDREVLNSKVYVDIPEEPIDTANGKRWLHTQKIPILDDNGNPIYLVGISEDITERKIQEDKIKELNKELEVNVAQLQEVNKELESFTYSVSHDLRAPLRAVSGYTEMLNEDYGNILDDEGKRILEVVRSNAIKMGKLIDDLLTFSRLGRKELLKTEVDMNKLFEEVLTDIQNSNQHKAEIKADRLPVVNADYGLMHQVLYNLLANAIKFSSKKDHSKVTISFAEKENEYEFSVKDNGAGFDMKYADKLFGVFQRLHSQEEFEGTGVGLAIVYKIVTKHGGKIWAEGKVDEGATFNFTIPKTKQL